MKFKARENTWWWGKDGSSGFLASKDGPDTDKTLIFKEGKYYEVFFLPRRYNVDFFAIGEDGEQYCLRSLEGDLGRLIDIFDFHSGTL